MFHGGNQNQSLFVSFLFYDPHLAVTEMGETVKLGLLRLAMTATLALCAVAMHSYACKYFIPAGVVCNSPLTGLYGCDPRTTVWCRLAETNVDPNGQDLRLWFK